MSALDGHSTSKRAGVAAISGAPSTVETISQKWGIVSKIPFLPRVFSDVYSFGSAHFETGDDPVPNFGSGMAAPTTAIPGIPNGRPIKGLIGWLGGHTILVVGAGRGGRWEKFVIETNEAGKRYIARSGWKRYLGG